MLCNEQSMLEGSCNDENFLCISDSVEDYIHTVLVTLVQNYHEVCDKNAVQQSLVNHYARNMDYLKSNLEMAEKLNEHYLTWQKKCDSLPGRKQKEIRQTLIRCFGIILHGIFPENFKKYHQMNSELEKCLLYLHEKFV